MLKRLGLMALISPTPSDSLKLGLFFCSLSPGFSCCYNSIWTQGWFLPRGGVAAARVDAAVVQRALKQQNSG